MDTELLERPRDLSTERWLEQFAGYPLNHRQRRILAYAHEHDSAFTNRAYQRVGAVARDQAHREIQKMIRLGVVARPSGRYSRMYFVVESPAQPPIPEEVTAIADVLSRQGCAANRDLRSVWRVSRFVTWKRAKRLVAEGFLRQEGEKSGTRYYPTDRLKALLARRSRAI